LFRQRISAIWQWMIAEFGGDPLTIVWDATKMQAQKDQQEESLWWRTSISLTVHQHIT